jgi:hypothetical protein
VNVFTHEVHKSGHGEDRATSARQPECTADCGSVSGVAEDLLNILQMPPPLSRDYFPVTLVEDYSFGL